jgi:ACT domain
MPTTIRNVDYAYVTVASKPGEAARILEALRDANVNLLAFSGFPQGRNRAQIDVVTGDIDGLKTVAKRHKWKLSRIKRAFLAQGTDEIGAAIPPLSKLAAAKINVIAADVVAAGEGRFGMLFWVGPRDYSRAAKLLEAL